jgi:hypothetical protein
VTFKNVPFYEISDQATGVFGENLISNGVWEINFKKDKITFSSTIDSPEDLGQAELFPSSYTDDGIKIPVTFPNNKTEDVDLDFGFNGTILLPKAEFTTFTSKTRAVLKEDLRFSTPTNKSILENIEALDSIRIHEKTFTVVMSTNDLARERLIGLGFFERFEFVIFDYKNKLFYVSKKKI